MLLHFHTFFSVVGSKQMIDVAESLGKRLVLPLNYPVVGWKELVNIVAPKNRLWARDERALDLLTRCLEVKNNCAYFRMKYVKTSETYLYGFRLTRPSESRPKMPSLMIT
jgi:hypothetical protein